MGLFQRISDLTGRRKRLQSEIEQYLALLETLALQFSDGLNGLRNEQTAFVRASSESAWDRLTRHGVIEAPVAGSARRLSLLAREAEERARRMLKTSKRLRRTLEQSARIQLEALRDLEDSR